MSARSRVVADWFLQCTSSSRVITVVYLTNGAPLCGLSATFDTNVLEAHLNGGKVCRRRRNMKRRSISRPRAWLVRVSSVQMSASGTKRTCRAALHMSAIGGVKQTCHFAPECPLVTQSGHWTRASVVEKSRRTSRRCSVVLLPTDTLQSLL